MLRVYQASRKNTIDTPSPSMHFLGSNDSQAFKKTQKPQTQISDLNELE